jgi:hypothetical protein
MTRTDMIAVALAPLVGGLVWWLFFRAAKFGHDYLWRRLPEGRLRRFLLRKVS